MLTVLSIGFPFAPVGPDPLGGAEQILAALDAYVARAGHASIVIAPAGSRVVGELIAAPAHAGPIDEAAWRRAHAAYRAIIARTLAERAIDAIHVHGLDFAAYVPATDLPVIATMHLPPSSYAAEALRAPGVRRICVSHAQRRDFPAGAIADVIPNGIATERYRPAATKGDYALALGRLCPEKGFDLALAAARTAGIRLILAGAAFAHPEHERHVREALVPLLDAERRWIGPVAGVAKRALLAHARCLVVPSRVEETCSLVALEALASGTPVAGFARGALPEVVEHGTTGWLVRDEAELPEAIARASALAPAACVAAARARGSAADMAARYLGHYASRPPRLASRARGVLEPRLVTCDDGLAALAPAWDALCERDPRATPFQRPGWLVAWRRWFGAGATPHVLALHRAGRLVAVVPLELRGRVARAIGAGITDYVDAIAEPELPAAVLADHVRRALAGAASRLELDGLRPGSPLVALGGARAPGVPSPVVALPAACEPARLAYERRRLARAGAVRWLDEQGALPALLDALFALHGARWRARGAPGVLLEPGLEGFHREAATALHARGLARMIGLEVDGRIAAVLYGFADHGRFLFYLSGFDPGLARLAPGRLAIGRAFDRAADEGVVEFDFLRGREPYKYEWGAVDRESVAIRLALEEDGCSRSAGRSAT